MNPAYSEDCLDDPVVNGKLKSISLADALKNYEGLQHTRAYYIIEGPKNTGTRFFGIVGDHTIFRVDEEVYQMLGRPQGGKRVPVCPIAVLDCYVRRE